MEKYYKQFDGNLFRFVGFAKGSESLEDLVVYQALADDRKMRVIPAKVFFDKVELNGQMLNRFEEIGEEEIPISSHLKYHFPNIKYTNEKPPLSSGKLSKSVRAMITLMQSRGIVKAIFFDGFKSDDDIEQEALRRIDKYEQGDDIESIFHLIQAWGGISGRGIYVHGNGFNWSAIEPAYKELIDVCLCIQRPNRQAISILIAVIEKFNKSIRHLGVSFITKHTRFWLHKTLGDFESLPIYDRIMATKFMGKDYVRSADLAEYWEVMLEKHHTLQIGLVPLERQIFLYYLNPHLVYMGFSFDYYRGEKENPFAGVDKNASLLWDREKLFYDTISLEGGHEFIEDIKIKFEDTIPTDVMIETYKANSLSKNDQILRFYLDL